jgi:hypothetical protein
MMKKILLIAFLYCAFQINAQLNVGYQKPHASIQQLADVTPPPFLILDSKGETGILLYRNSFKTIDELSQPELRLGGLRINPMANISSRQTYFYKASIFFNA